MDRCVNKRTSSETQQLLVGMMPYFRASDSLLQVYFRPKISLPRKYRIVPTSSPWVSEDDEYMYCSPILQVSSKDRVPLRVRVRVPLSPIRGHSAVLS